MKYLGSKNRISKYILPIILKNRKREQLYIEPFVGGCNLIDKIDGKRIASDFNYYLIEMWKGLQENRNRPYKISKEMYNNGRMDYNSKTNNYYDDFTIGWIGWMGSYNGRFYDGGYSGSYEKRDYISEQIRNTEKQIPYITDVEFTHNSYDKLDIPDNSIIYCDIPYKDTKQYSVSKSFDYDKFWNWCRINSKNNEIFISEYNAPSDFDCIWEKEITNSMNPTKTYKPTERLFKYNN